MVLDIFANALFSLASLAWNSLLYSVPIFLVALLVGNPLHSFFRSRFKRSWIQSAFLASYVVLLIILIFAFFFPVWRATQDTQLFIPLAAVQLTPAELAGQFVFGLIKMLLVAGVFGLLVLPLILAGGFVYETLKNRVTSSLARAFLSVWTTVFLVLLLLLFFIPWVIPGLLYLVYWA